MSQQQYANTAWSLAVLGQLRGAQFELLLDQLVALLVRYPELSPPSQLKDPELGQLHQALDWLQLPQNADTLERNAWLKVKEKLGSLGPQPAPEAHPGAQLFCSSLTQLSLRFKAMPAISGYRTVAVLEPTGNEAPIVITLESNMRLMNNQSRSLSFVFSIMICVRPVGGGFNKTACKCLQFCHSVCLLMLTLYMAYISTKIYDVLLCCSPKPFLACAADLDMLASLMVA